MTFTTVVDNQQSVEIHIMQGEREVAAATAALQSSSWSDSAGSARRSADRCLVRDRRERHRERFGPRQDDGPRTGNADHPSSGLAPEEIDRLIMEAEDSIEKDRDGTRNLSQRIRLENMLKNARRAMAEYGRSVLA
jgi:molecular chaperone DnaK